VVVFVIVLFVTVLFVTVVVIVLVVVVVVLVVAFPITVTKLFPDVPVPFDAPPVGDVLVVVVLSFMRKF
jgi:hypothetical protein